MLLPHITHKQKEILLFLYRFRFLNRIQIQKLLHHKSSKNTNVWLKDLTDKDYLSRIYEKKAGINDPAIYFMAKNGVKFLRSLEGIEGDYLRKLYQENRRSQAFIDQCITVADIYLKLNAQQLPGFKFYTQSDFPANGVIRDLLPSFAYVFEKDGEIWQCTGEIIKDGTPRFAIRSRVQKYVEFFKDQEQIDVVFYCRSSKLLDYLEKRVKMTLEESEDSINMIVSKFAID